MDGKQTITFRRRLVALNDDDDAVLECGVMESVCEVAHWNHEFLLVVTQEPVIDWGDLAVEGEGIEADEWGGVKEDGALEGVPEVGALVGGRQIPIEEPLVGGLA